MQGELVQLQGRVVRLEQRLAAAPGATAQSALPRLAETPEDRRTALVKAGVAEDAAADILWRQGQHELDRRELREATAAGERGEPIAVKLPRADGSRVDVWLPRGPLGVRLDLSRADPDV